MPGGNWRTIVCEIAVVCASAVWMLALGWKKILTTAIAGERLRLDVLDVVDQRGEEALGVRTMRSSISSGARPA